MLVMAGVVLHYCVSGAIFFTPPDSKGKSQGAEIMPAEHSSFVARVKTKFVFFEFFRDALFMLFIASFIFNMMGSGPVTTLIIHYAEEFGVGDLSTPIHTTVILPCSISIMHIFRWSSMSPYSSSQLRVEFKF